MTDLDDRLATAVRAAVSDAAARTPAPPFALVAARAAGRRTRRRGGVAVAATAVVTALVVAAGAVAGSGGRELPPAGHPGRKPYPLLEHDWAVRLRVADCLARPAADEAACYRAEGYEPPPAHLRGLLPAAWPPGPPRPAERAPWRGAPHTTPPDCGVMFAGDPGATVSGPDVDGGPALLTFFAGNDGTDCLRVRYGDRQETFRVGRPGDPLGPTSPVRLAARGHPDETPLLFYGTAAPGTAAVRLRVNAVVRDVPTVRVAFAPDRVLFAAVVYPGGPAAWEYRHRP